MIRTANSISAQRVDIARYHTDDRRTDAIMEAARSGKIQWQQAADMLASNLMNADCALNGYQVFDHSSQEWIGRESPQPIDESPRTVQSQLLTGLDCLPGQRDWIEERQ